MALNLTSCLLGLALLLNACSVSAFRPPASALTGLRSGSLRPRSQTRSGSVLEMKGGSVLEEAAATGYFKTALTAIKACGLDAALSGPGPFTLFLPSDDAFSKLPPGALEGLLKDIPKLTEILKFHVHPGKKSPMRTGTTINTLLLGKNDYPKQLTVKVTNWTCISFIFGGGEVPAQVMGTGDGIKYTGIECSNGLIHELNLVLTPYETDEPPKITFIGFGGITEKPRLQLDYYGPQAGQGRNKVGTLDMDKNFRAGDAWKEGCNYELPINDKGEKRLG